MKNSVVYREDIHEARLALGYRTFGANDPRRYAASILDALVGHGMSSRLFQELREKRGLSYDIASRMHFFTDAGMFVISAGINPAKTDLALKTIEAELKKLCVKPVSKAELKRTKDFMLGNFRLHQEKLTAKMFFYGQLHLAFGHLVLPQEQIEGIRKVTAEDLQAVAKTIFKPANRSVNWVLPKESKK